MHTTVKIGGSTYEIKHSSGNYEVFRDREELVLSSGQLDQVTKFLADQFKSFATYTIEDALQRQAQS